MRISSSYFTEYSTAQMNAKQTELARLQEQISSGKRINKPSDDPATAARVQTIDSTRSRIEQLQKNSVIANQRVALEEDTLDRVTDMVQRLQELSLAAKSGTVTAEKLSAYGSEVQQHLYELIDYGNTQNANGEYIFAGKMGKTQPFIIDNNRVTYQGDQGNIELQIGSSRTVAVSDSGDEIFQNIATGNGTFVVGANAANTGTGVIGSGTVVNNGAYQANDFRVVFTTDTTFDVINDSTGATELANQAYSDSATFSFNGIALSVRGTPVAGDEFTIEPSRQEDLFSTLQRFIAAAENNPANANERAQLDQELNTVLENLEQAHIHISTMRSSIGSRLNYIDAAVQENGSVDFLLQTTLSDLTDTDYAKAASQLEFEMTTLEAVRQTFVKLQSNSLFNYL